MEDLTRNFDVLLDKAKRLFELSEVKFRQDRNTLKWGLSLCATPVNAGKAVILGISWGGASLQIRPAILFNADFRPKRNFWRIIKQEDTHLFKSRKS